MQATALFFGLLATVLLDGAGSANALLKGGDFEAARVGYAKTVEANPSDVGALIGLATTELYDDDLADAERHDAIALRLDPSNAAAQRLLRTISQRRGAPGEFVVTQRADAVLQFVQSEPIPVVTLRINGTDAHVVLDTGADGLTVSPAFARRHHLALRAVGMGIFAGGKHAPIEGTTIASLSAGPITIRSIHATVLPPPDPSIDGVIGTGFFRHFLTTVDYQHKRLILRPKGAHAPGAVLASEHMWLVGDHFIFAKASINARAPMLFNVDSGSDFGFQLTSASLRSAGITPGSTAKSFQGGGGGARVVPLSATSVAIGAAREQNVSGVYFPDGDQYGIFPFAVAGTISGGFLSHYAVTYDFTHMTLELSTNT